MNDLLDANVWIALTVPDHVHHARAVRYVKAEAGVPLSFCRVTELALLRLLSNVRAFKDVALTGQDAWRTLQALFESPKVTRLEEPAALDDVLGAWSGTLDIRGKHWTDAYLAAFAIASGCRLVSYDADFGRFPGLSWLQLKDD